MRYDEASRRREWILGTLRTAGFLSISALAQELGVSDMTVRRDLRRLELTGEVRTVRGGVSLRHGTLRTSDFLRRADTQAEAKRSVARAAARLVREGDTLAIDSGTSNYELAAALPEDFRGSVITPSVPVVQLMLNRPRTRVVALGGELIVSSQAFAGPMAVQAAAGLRVRLLFLGAVAVDDRGVYVHTDVEIGVKRALMEIADEVVLLADSSKFRATAPVKLIDLSRLSALVTDARPDVRTAAALRGAGVELLVAREGDGATAAR